MQRRSPSQPHQCESFCQCVNGAVNHAAIETEEEPADRSYAAQRDHIRRPASLIVNARHSDILAR